MFWLEGGSNYTLLGESQLFYPLDYRALLIKLNILLVFILH